MKPTPTGEQHAIVALAAMHGAARDAIANLEAERDQFKQLYRHALDCVDQVFQVCSEIPNPILPDFCQLGEDKFRAVVRLAKEYAAACETLQAMDKSAIAERLGHTA